LWYDGGCGAWLNPELERFREWDPTHPTFVGSKYCGGIEELTNAPGVLAWEDLDWHNPGETHHFADMMNMHRRTRELGSLPGRWIVSAGMEKDRFTLHQSIAAGLKCVMWFLGGPWDRQKQEFVSTHHFVPLSLEIAPLYSDLMQIGRPVAVYSTPTTRTPANDPKEAGVPAALDPVPRDWWLQVESGEALLGFYRYPDGREAVYAANHNAFAPQKLTCRFTAAPHPPVERYDSKNRRWIPIPIRDRAFAVKIAPGGGTLLRCAKRADGPR
jgi:hypothetical protein